MQTANLTAFIAVAETGSFSRAAERLFLSQPAVSKRVSALEEELEAKLFDRIGHQIFLTEAGRALLPRAQRILAELDNSLRQIRNLSGQVSGRLSIGTSHHIGLHRLPPVLREYSARYPEVELDLHFMDSEAILAAVGGGQLEFGVITLPLQLPQQLEAQSVWRDPLCFVCSAQHPLAQRKRITPQQLGEHPAILPTADTTTYQILAAELQKHQCAIRRGMTTNNLETIRMLVSIGLGWSLLPSGMLGADLVALKPNHIRLSRTLGMVFHRDRTLSNAAKRMVELLQEQAAPGA
ncbi:MAG: LysR family transcriptional regulator [Pseudomonadota bacterium]